MNVYRFGVVFLFLSFLSPCLQAAELASHQAAYRLSLSSRKNNAEIVDLSGVLTSRLEQVCDGWILAQKMSQRLDSPSAGIIVSESSSAIMEAPGGNLYRFSTRQKNGAAILDVRGQAKKNQKGEVIVQYTKPLAKTQLLPVETIFPIAHTRLLLDAAMSGKKLANHRIFDGFDGASGYLVTTVISRLSQENGLPQSFSPLLKGELWHMRMAYFQAQVEASAPIMEISVILRANGVAEKIIFEYERFGIKAELERVEAIARPVCR